MCSLSLLSPAITRKSSSRFSGHLLYRMLVPSTYRCAAWISFSALKAAPAKTTGAAALPKKKIEKFYERE
jgi:hypothetical protein